MRVLATIGAVLALAVSTSACTAETQVTPEERGQRLASATTLSPSRFNAWSCTSCHAESAAANGPIKPGAPLGGAIDRPRFWGGRIATMRDAVDECLQHFMKAPPLDPTTADAKDLYAYLASIAARGPKVETPLTIVERIDDAYVASLPAGDSLRGARVYADACASCHGAPHTADGAPRSASGDREASLIPEDTIAEHGDEGAAVLRAVVIEKVRHGSFLGYAGTMPPFAKERLTDQQLADVLAYLSF